jgi:hypothetical protein
MGKTIAALAHREISDKAIFQNRFCVEDCEQFHIHYRNLRLSLSVVDWEQFAKGVVDAYSRWKTRGCPDCPKVHIELCRKHIASDALNEGIKINLNENLYNANEGRIFAEGSVFTEPVYIHLKTRDMRLEMSVDEFRVLASAVKEAEANLARALPMQEVPQGVTEA